MPVLESQKLYDSIEQSLQTNQFQPLYTFVGEEAYLIQQATQFLCAAVMQGIPKDFNYTSYFAEDIEVPKLVDEVETLPVFAERRMVVVKNVDQFSEKKWEELLPVLKNPVPSTVLLLTGDKLDKRKKSFKLLESSTVFVEFKKPFDNQIPTWISRISKTYGLSLTDEARDLFHRLVGSQLLEIDSEMRKLREFVGESREVGLQEVALCVSRLKEDSVFEFVRVLVKADLGQSLEQLIRLLDQGQSEVGIVHLVARHFRILLQVKQALAQGLTSTKIATAVQVPQFFIKEYIEQTKVWNLKKLQTALLICAEVDKALKSSPISSAIWLENFVLKLNGLHQGATEISLERR
jgi:DNA polymerase-3 subunit delta